MIDIIPRAIGEEVTAANYNSPNNELINLVLNAGLTPISEGSPDDPTMVQDSVARYSLVLPQLEENNISEYQRRVQISGSNLQLPETYINNMRINFRVKDSNISNNQVTFQIGSLAAKNLYDTNGLPIINRPYTLLSGDYVTVVYRSVADPPAPADRFVLLPPPPKVIQVRQIDDSTPGPRPGGGKYGTTAQAWVARSFTDLVSDHPDIASLSGGNTLNLVYGIYDFWTTQHLWSLGDTAMRLWDGVSVLYNRGLLYASSDQDHEVSASGRFSVDVVSPATTKPIQLQIKAQTANDNTAAFGEPMLDLTPLSDFADVYCEWTLIRRAF